MLLYSDLYLSLHAVTAESHVRLIRSAQQFGSVSRVATSLRGCAKALGRLDVSKLGILLDWRLAPLTTDPVLLRHVVQQSDRFAAAFARRALLLSTPIGVMQSERLARTIDHAKPRLFDDEAAALAFVRDNGG